MKINKQLLAAKIAEYVTMFSEPGWGGMDEFPVTQGAADKILKLIDSFPDEFPNCEVFPECYGDFQLFWGSQNGNVRLFEEDNGEWVVMLNDREHYSTFISFRDELPEPFIARLMEIANENQ